ncbi:MAG: Flp pilus assembly complex ATPase component TadA [Lentilactobacillus diolivorans]|jgi:competence protein ComGA|nr:Flp pilus assembly complex ATPase component TadA [Lentilactobacillus diolivorans]RRG04541.1 MAG: competence protein ComGA [Lactobacillus sp.]
MEISEQVNALLMNAITHQASDIYFLPTEDGYVIKIRGVQEIIIWDEIKYLNARRMMNYCKYLADMALSEQRRPQIGAMEWYIDDIKYDLRLSAVGNFAGKESLVIRIIYSLADLSTAFFNEAQKHFLEELSSRRGLIIFSGPTGSGKTTTIYSLVHQLVADQFVMTIEDPIEIKDPRFLQLQVNNDAGMGYSELIKVGLRHRPDIFIIGEIRDSMTAQAAIKAALSGHLVYTTVHAQNPLGVISRLKQLGVDESFISQAVTAVAYQRLIPTIQGKQKALLMAHEYAELSRMNRYDWKEWNSELEKAVNRKMVTKQVAQKFQLG